MKRITIIGPPGSGKSTLARKLGEKWLLPVFHLDQLFFNPGWEPKEKDVFLKEVEEILDTYEEWIVEGNYSATLPKRLDKSTHIYFLDLPRGVYARRVLKRIVKSYGKVREDAALGCPERIDLEFLKYVWNFPKRRDRLHFLLKEYEIDNVTVLKTQREVDTFLSSL